MGITIGRLGRSPAGAGVELDVQSFRQSGDTITVGGDLLPAAGDSDPINTMRAMRAQLMGYVSDGGDGEPAVPVVWADDPHYNGMYRVVSAEVTPTDVTLAAGRVLWSATLQRVVHAASPWTETRSTLMLMSNAHSYVPVTNLLGSVVSLPGTVVELQNSLLATPFAELLSGADGNELRINHAFGGAGDTVSAVTYRARIPLADWYVGACTVEGQWGSNWYPLVGRQATAELTGVRIRNGQIRVTPSSSGLDVEWWGGAGWVSAFTAALMHDGAGLNLVRDVAILRNSPETVIVRISWATSSGAPAVFTIDVSLRRGSRVATVVMTQWQSVLLAARIYYLPVAAFSTVAGVPLAAIRKTTNDASGNRPVLMCADTNTQDLVNGTLTTPTLASGGPWPTAGRFGIGCEIPGGTATVGIRALDLASDFMQPIAQRTTLVGR